jgi:hypothetical protein
MVLLPEPLGPTIAVVAPALISKEAFSRIFLNSLGAVGYLNVTLLKLILSFKII